MKSVLLIILSTVVIYASENTPTTQPTSSTVAHLVSTTQGSTTAEVSSTKTAAEVSSTTSAEVSSTTTAEVSSTTNYEANFHQDDARRELLMRSLPWPVLQSEPHGFALLFQATRSLEASTVWQRWVDDAFEWIHAQGLESIHVPRNESKILRSYLHHMPYLTPDSVRDCSPSFLQDSLVPKPAACWWGPTNPCALRLIEHAYNDFAEAGYFFLASPNTIPLKSFSHIYKSFLEDKRARVRIVYPLFGDSDAKLPKTSLWKGFPRSWAKLMIDDRAWAQASWAGSFFWKDSVAAPDEWAMLSPIYNALGESMFDQIHDGSDLISSVKYDRLVWVHDCWFGAACPNSETKGGGPSIVTHFDEFFLNSMIENPHNWFFRKATDETLVKLSSGVNVSISDYLESKLFKAGFTSSPEQVVCDNEDLREIGRKPSWKAVIAAVREKPPKGVVSNLDEIETLID